MAVQSWRLKVARAKKHMEEIKQEAILYSDSEPFEMLPMRRPRGDFGPLDLFFRLHFIREPDPMIAVIVGDFVHNLRSALDHVIVASVPRKFRKSAGYPLEHRPIWAVDETDQFVIKDDEARRKFKSQIEGLSSQGEAFVKATQPYNAVPNPDRALLHLISRLENADKHRELVTIGSGIEHPTFVMTARGQTIERPGGIEANQFLKEGTIYRFRVNDAVPPLKQSEVNVKCRGTTAIDLRLMGPNRREPDTFNLLWFMPLAIREIEKLLTVMERFVLE